MKWWHATDLADAQSGYLESLAFSAADAQSPEVVFIHDFDDDLKTESIRHVPSHLSRSLVTLENYCGNISRIKKCEEASLVMVRFVTQITPIEQDCEQALDHGPIGNYSAKNRHRFDSHDPKHASADVKTKKVGAMITVTNREAV